MSSFGLSYFDKALDSVIDGLENSVVDRTRAIASDLLSEEYKAPAQQPVLQTDAPGVLNNLNDVTGYWRLFNIQVCLSETYAPLVKRAGGHSSETELVTVAGKENRASEEKSGTPGFSR